MDLYRIDPKDVEETIKIHKMLMLAEYVNINQEVIEHLYNIAELFSSLLYTFNPNEFQKLKQNCLKLTVKLNETIDKFLMDEMNDCDELHKYATLIMTLTGVIKAYELIFGSRLKEGLKESLNSLGAVKVDDLENMEGDQHGKV